MYIEKLTLHNPDEPSILEAVMSCDDQDPITRAHDVATIVRAGIQPIRARVGTFDLNPESLAEYQRGNCYGSNVVLSEGFSSVGIDHYIAFANDHVFTLKIDNATRAYLFDAHSPDFNGDITSAIFSSERESMQDTIAQFGRAMFRLDTGEVVKNSKFRRPFDELVMINPWLSYGSEAQLLDRRHASETKARLDHSLIATAYDASLGRFIIDTRSRLHRNIEVGNFVEAASDSHAMRGLYPEIDPRNKEKARTLGSLALNLAREQELELALQVIEDMRESYAINPNPNLAIWPADQLRKIGSALGLKDFVLKAVDEYSAAVSKYPDNRLLRDKLSKAKSLA